MTTYPSTEELTKPHNFLANVKKSKLKEKYMVKKINNNGTTKIISCNSHPSQRHFNVLKTILRQWKMPEKSNKNILIYDLEKASEDLEMVHYTYDKTTGKRKSNNKAKNFQKIKKLIVDLASFLIKIQTTETTTIFNIINDFHSYKSKKNELEIHLNQVFLQQFKVEKKIQYVPLIIVKGEWEQKILEFLMTKVQTQGGAGIHKHRRFRLQAFSIDRIVNHFKLKSTYEKNPELFRKKISSGLKSIREQILKKGIDYIIPKYRYKKGMFEVTDYCYGGGQN